MWNNPEIIDTHIHLWEYDAKAYPWISGDMEVLQSDFLPPDLARIYLKEEISGCVAVQARHSVEETEFLVNLANQHHFIRGVVGWTDLQDEGVEERLDRLTSFPAIKGIRHIVQDETDPDFLNRPAFRRGISALEPRAFVYDLLIYHYQIPAAIRFVAGFPNQQFVLDHIAKPDIRNGDTRRWQKRLNKLAAFPNVSCKLSGMIIEAEWKTWRHEDILPYMEAALEAFGTERLMFGSDWPVCLLAGDYTSVLRLVRQFISTLSQDERRSIFSENAKRIYNLE